MAGCWPHGGSGARFAGVLCRLNRGRSGPASPGSGRAPANVHGRPSAPVDRWPVPAPAAPLTAPAGGRAAAGASPLPGALGRGEGRRIGPAAAGCRGRWSDPDGPLQPLWTSAFKPSIPGSRGAGSGPRAGGRRLLPPATRRLGDPGGAPDSGDPRRRRRPDPRVRGRAGHRGAAQSGGQPGGGTGAAGGSGGSALFDAGAGGERSFHTAARRG